VFALLTQQLSATLHATQEGKLIPKPVTKK